MNNKLKEKIETQFCLEYYVDDWWVIIICIIYQYTKNVYKSITHTHKLYQPQKAIWPVYL